MKNVIFIDFGRHEVSEPVANNRRNLEPIKYRRLPKKEHKRIINPR